MAHRSQGWSLPSHQQVLGMTADINGMAWVHLCQRREQIRAHCLDELPTAGELRPSSTPGEVWEGGLVGLSLLSCTCDP